MIAFHSKLQLFGCSSLPHLESSGRLFQKTTSVGVKLGDLGSYMSYGLVFSFTFLVSPNVSLETRPVYLRQKSLVPGLFWVHESGLYCTS